MKLQYLGTAAAEGIPGIFCECPVCKEARQKGGRFIRTRSQALIDDRLLIDFNADTYLHVLRYNVDLPHIRSVLITHSHSDHCYPADFGMRRPGFAITDGTCPEVLTVYGSEAVGRKMEDAVKGAGGAVAFRKVEPYETFDVEGYTVTALPARHDPNAGPLFYVISDGTSAMLYGHDTGYYFDEVWAYFKEKKLHLDLVSMDCTEANRIIGYDAHANVERDALIRTRLLEDGVADDKTVFVMNHFSHNGGDVSYDTFLPIAAENGCIVSYDGMILEF